MNARKRLKGDRSYVEGPNDDLASSFNSGWQGRYMQVPGPYGEPRLYEFVNPKRLAHSLPVFEWNRVSNPETLARYGIAPWVSAEEPAPSRCGRCGSLQQTETNPGLRGTSADLLEASPTLRERVGIETCAFCAGHSMANLIDMAWKLEGIPTDALLRELARRFL